MHYNSLQFGSFVREAKYFSPSTAKRKMAFFFNGLSMPFRNSVSCFGGIVSHKPHFLTSEVTCNSELSSSLLKSGCFLTESMISFYIVSSFQN